MTKEVRQVYTHQPDGIQKPYSDYISGRNANLGRYSAKLHNAEFKGPISEVTEEPEFRYGIFATSLGPEEAGKFHIKDESDFLGAAFRKKINSIKSQLHQSFDSPEYFPDGYSLNLAKKLEDMTLPGGVFFTQEGGLELFQSLVKRDLPVLLKLPHESDFMGQYDISSEEELVKTLNSLDKSRVKETGVILEAKVEDPKTISVGQIYFKGQDYSLIAYQDDLNHNGRRKFGGGEIVVARGKIKDLSGIVDEEKEEEAINKVNKTYTAFGIIDPIAVSRMSFDFVCGRIGKQEVSGLTDITARVGGYTPAEIMAIKYLIENQDKNFVRAESKLLYDNEGKGIEGEIFLNHPKLIIAARLLL